MPAVESKGARFISRLNGIFKIAIAVINLLVILFSLALASFGIYIQAGNWGSRPGTFISNVSNPYSEMKKEIFLSNMSIYN